MPNEYEALVAELKGTDIPFAEYAWDTRPAGKHGVVSLDFEADGLEADDAKKDRAWEASVDVFFQKLSDQENITRTVEAILPRICGDRWELNHATHETATRMFHIEWACRVQNTKGVS